MSNDENMICQEFEIEAFLYLDNDLPVDKKEYWEKHLSTCKTCSAVLEEAEFILGQAKAELTEDLSEAEFNEQIEHAINRRRFKIAEWLFPQGTAKEKFAFSLKLAVVGVLAAIAVIISLTTQRPNTVKAISKELLDWEGEKVTSQINEIKNTINLIHEDNWDRQIIMLDERMKVLEKESDKFSFN